MLNISSIESYQKYYQKSIENPEDFWDEIASGFFWQKKWDKTLDWNFNQPDVKWFIGGKLNITENCLDRHLADRPDQIAIIWEPNNPGDKVRIFTYRELHQEVCRFANVLKKNGAEKGDRICIYMPMVPEAVIAVLACARIGAIHSVAFGGFSAQSLSDRIQDCDASFVITSDGGWRGAKQIPIKAVVDEALVVCPSVQKVIVYRHTGSEIQMKDGRDLWWQNEMANSSSECPATSMDSEDELFILYTSGSTGKPKGVVHTCGGYMVYTAYTFQNVFQ